MILDTLENAAKYTGLKFGSSEGFGFLDQPGLADLPDLVDARHLGYLPREEVLAVCTGSQGEPRSALSRMAADSDRWS